MFVFRFSPSCDLFSIGNAPALNSSTRICPLRFRKYLTPQERASLLLVELGLTAFDGKSLKLVQLLLSLLRPPVSLLHCSDWSFYPDCDS